MWRGLYVTETNDCMHPTNDCIQTYDVHLPGSTTTHEGTQMPGKTAASRSTAHSQALTGHVLLAWI